MAIVDSARLIVGGVDTHRDANVAAVVDMNGCAAGQRGRTASPALAITLIITIKPIKWADRWSPPT